jgi:hypothetical protein
MLDRRAAQIVVIKGIRRLLAPMGYSRRKLCWYRHGDHCQTACDIRLTRNLVSVRLLRFDSEYWKRNHPDPSDASDSVGMSALVPSLVQWRKAREFAKWSAVEDSEPLFLLFEQYGLPRLRRWNDG